MKNGVLTLLTALLFLMGCKKDNNDPDYYVKLKINGNWVTWKTVAGELGPDFANATKTDFGVTANDDASTQVFDLTIQVDGPNFNTGTYVSDNLNYWVVISYVSGANTANMKYYDIQDASNRPASKYTINVTSITDTELRGTFTGNYLLNYTDDETIDITEGEFKVRRAR
jgi:hypothetical protein